MRTGATRFALPSLMLVLATIVVWAAPTVALGQDAFSPAGSMTNARNAPTATLLGSGKVLFAGGDTSSGSIVSPDTSAELYEPTTNAFSRAAIMATARTDHTATLLGSGKVLIAGGSSFTGPALASAELYDP